jgi:hypothetical protein
MWSLPGVPTITSFLRVPKYVLMPPPRTLGLTIVAFLPKQRAPLPLLAAGAP